MRVRARHSGNYKAPTGTTASNYLAWCCLVRAGFTDINGGVRRIPATAVGVAWYQVREDGKDYKIYRFTNRPNVASCYMAAKLIQYESFFNDFASFYRLPHVWSAGATIKEGESVAI